jgi:mannose-6-phosphate isomerase-like protein (cupin superfamily)
MIPFKIGWEHAIDQLRQQTDKKPFIILGTHGSMQIEYFAPKITDNQSPHLQDEIYVIAAGSSDFYRGGETVSCTSGDVLFVPAGMEHRFKNFSDDFATWVIFYGPEGGEKE